MRFKSLLLASLCIASNSVLASIQTQFFQTLDVNQVHEMEVSNELKGEAPRFAVPHLIHENIGKKLKFNELTNRYEWSKRFFAPNAVSLNFGFKYFQLPSSASIKIYSNDKSKSLPSFDYTYNNSSQELWTPVIDSDDVILSVSVSPEEKNSLQLILTHLGQGFRHFSQNTKKAGSCNIDVACSDSEGWEKEVNSVAVISTGGYTFCTGFMVNNTNQDRTPYFMTARHCRITASNAASLVTYWNYQTSKCKGPRDGSKSQFTTGSTFLASSAKSDFALVKLNQNPDPSYGVTYAGWDRSGENASMAVAIHHPNTDEKSISFEYDETHVTGYGTSSAGPKTHVMVEDWDKGTTEPGSSGSPLFNQDHRVIGQLHGGGAACGNDLPDWYGRFYVSWEGDGSANSRLKDHLDPNNSGELFVDTIE